MDNRNKIEDYLHLYIGCMVVVDCMYGRTPIQLTGVSELGAQIRKKGNSYYYVSPEDCKPILRRIKDMTHEERCELYFLIFQRQFPEGGQRLHYEADVARLPERWGLWSGVERLIIYADGEVGADVDLHYKRHNQHEVTRFFLNKGFDIFGLIDAGLAIAVPSPRKHE